MLMLDRFGVGGSFTEFYAMDFRDGFVLMGHDGPGHIAISDARPCCAGWVCITASAARAFRWSSK